MSPLLPDYFEALASAIERLPRNDRATRGALYDRARRLLMEEAQKADPPWQLMEIVREQRTLEEAIVKAEANFGAQVAAPSRPRAPSPARPRQPQPARPRDYDDEDQYEPPAREAPPHVYEDEEEEYDAPPAPARLPQTVPRRQGRRAPPPPARASYPMWVWGIVGGVVLLILILLVLLLRPAQAPVAPTASQPPARIDAKAPPQSEEAKARAEERNRRQLELIARGNDASRTQDYAGAIAAYTEAITLGPVEATVYNNRAFAYWSRGMTDDAIADYEQAIRREPENIVALTNRAVAYNFRGDYDAAIRDLDRALALKPDSPDVLNSRCWGRTLAGHLQAAIADCN
jgi:tetratricopeptide (TPR) repeat protein